MAVNIWIVPVFNIFPGAQLPDSEPKLQPQGSQASVRLCWSQAQINGEGSVMKGILYQPVKWAADRNVS